MSDSHLNCPWADIITTAGPSLFEETTRLARKALPSPAHHPTRIRSRATSMDELGFDEMKKPFLGMVFPRLIDVLGFCHS